MTLNIIAKNLELTPAINAYINRKLKFLVKTLSDWDKKGSLQVDFEITKTTRHHRKGDVFYAEANIKLGGNMLRAEQKSDDIYKSIDLVKDILKREIDKYKIKHFASLK